LVAIIILSIWERKISQKTHFLSCIVYEVDKNIRNYLVFIHCYSHCLFNIPSTESINCLLIISLHLKMTTFDRNHVRFVLFIQIDSGRNLSRNFKKQFFLSGQTSFKLNNLSLWSIFFSNAHSHQNTSNIVRSQLRKKLINIFMLLIRGIGRRSIKINPLHLSVR